MTDMIHQTHDFFKEDNERRLYKPIPIDAGEVDGWKEIPIDACSETLVALGAFSREAGSILTSSVYYGEHSSSPYILEYNKLSGALLTVFAREKVAARLLEAEQLLPERHHLLVFDAYRPVEVQASLYALYRDQLESQRPDMTSEELDIETQKYVSMPSFDPAKPSPHNTGGSVDLAIVKLNAESEKLVQAIDEELRDGDMDIEARIRLEMKKSAIVRQHSILLDFGTAFDHGGERAALTYFEQKIALGEVLSPEEKEACQNRRLLYNVMSHVGMQPYFAEWWHFNAPESQMGSKAAGTASATYGAADFDLSNATHEELRQEIYKAAVDAQEKRMGLEAHLASSAVQIFFSEILETTGEPRLASQWSTEVIAPQFESPAAA